MILNPSIIIFFAIHKFFKKEILHNNVTLKQFEYAFIFKRSKSESFSEVI